MPLSNGNFGLGGKATYSPSFTLDVVTPYTEQEAQQTMTAQENSELTWQNNLIKYGDTKKARDETVKAVKKLEGIKDAGVTSDGVNIWIEFKSGIRGGMVLSQEGSEARGTTGPFMGEKEKAAMRRVDSSLSALQSTCKQKSDTAGGTFSVGNCDVLIWDWYALDSEQVRYDSIFYTNPDNKFKVDKRIGGEELDGCRVDSLRDITKYGTLIVRTPDTKGRVGTVYATNEGVTWQKLGEEKYMFDLLTGCLEALIDRAGVWRFYFTPSFISTLEGHFDNGMVYFESSNSSELATAFLGKGVHTFFGYSGIPIFTVLFLLVGWRIPETICSP